MPGNFLSEAADEQSCVDSAAVKMAPDYDTRKQLLALLEMINVEALVNEGAVLVEQLL